MTTIGRSLGILCLVACCWATSLLAGPMDTLWTRTYGGSDMDRSGFVELTSDGGYLIVGDTKSYGAGGTDVYVIKTDANGDTVWTRAYGGSGDDHGMKAVQTPDGGYLITGWTESFGAGEADIYLVRTDANGDSLWTRTYGGSAWDSGNSIQIVPEGGYIMAAQTRSFGAGSIDVYLLRLDENGDTLWARTYGTHRADNPQTVIVTADGGFMIGGPTLSYGNYRQLWLIKTDNDGDVLWIADYGGGGDERGGDVRQTPDGGYILGGSTDSFGAGSFDFYLVKTDSVGGVEWTQTHGGAGYDRCGYLCQTVDGGYIMIGRTNSFGEGGFDFYAVKTDAGGNLLWTNTYGGPGNDQAWGIRQASDGGYIFAGQTDSYGAGGLDVYLVKTEGQVCNATIDIDPDTQNVRNKGRWITGYIELPEGHDVADIDIETVALNDLVPAELWPTEIADHDSNGVYDLMVKFSRSAVQEILPTGEEVEVRVSGEVGSLMFSGADTIRVLPPHVTWPDGGEILEVGAEYDICWEPQEGHVPDRYGVYYTPDDGDNWEAIVRNTGGTSYTWTVPDIASGCCLVLVEAYDAEGLMGSDFSDGPFSICAGAAVTEDLIPTQYRLYPGNPNPFAHNTLVRYDLPESRRVRLSVHDVQGHLVRVLVDDVRPARSHATVWDGRDELGAEVSGGIYFIRLKGATTTESSKVVVLR